MLASTLRQREQVGVWNTIPISGCGPRTGRPSRRTAAVKGAGRTSTMMVSAAEGPTIETISSAPISNEHLSIATRSPEQVL